MRAAGKLREDQLPSEQLWISLSTQLSEHGYQLRPRYREGWTPSWNLEENIDMDPRSFEDYIIPPVSRTLHHSCSC